MTQKGATLKVACCVAQSSDVGFCVVGFSIMSLLILLGDDSETVNFELVT